MALTTYRVIAGRLKFHREGAPVIDARRPRTDAGVYTDSEENPTLVTLDPAEYPHIDFGVLLRSGAIEPYEPPKGDYLTIARNFKPKGEANGENSG